MSEGSEHPRELNRILHSPARLRIMTVLQYGSLADFRALQQLTGLSSSNLSQQISKLEEAKYVEVSKQSRGRRAVTRVSITESGKSAIDEHWRLLELMREEAKSWNPPKTPEELGGEKESMKEA